MSTEIKRKNGRCYGYGKVDGKGKKFVAAAEAVYGKHTPVPANGFTDEDWEEMLLSKHTDANVARAAVKHERRARREARRRRAAAKRAMLRLLVATAVVIMIVGGVFIAAWNWYAASPVFLVALLLEIFVLGGGAVGADA